MKNAQDVVYVQEAVLHFRVIDSKVEVLGVLAGL